MKTRYKMTLAYDGHLFHGFQSQPHQRTIQKTIEAALIKMTKGEMVPIEGSGRTDAGVHAYDQVIHFDYPGNKIAAERMIYALNSMMPLDIIFKKCEIVDPSFHVRYSAKGKWYRYRMSLDRFVDPFKRFYTGHYPYPIDVEKIKIAAQDLVGTHDFTSFTASGGQIKNKVRTMYYTDVNFDQEANELIFDFICSGFLYNMVRILVATLLEIGNGKRPVNDIPRIIKAKDRNQVRETAQANGLYLYHVFYEDVPIKYRQDSK
ncbi:MULTISPECIES: tRNA pseudouridine(38-40) synthase TruA [unclassified Lactobacillus]|uniref:tRNA pseudouridine(38-40) synthase TruA n=1 Tax=unclassified Lactobacillus TaxID=2620435 RepID=UPI000EFD2047|nr:MULTISPECIES: tRNA pseudouridine(38-40) synthase TruA [unclassified Lactobacillus]RMC38460.1 tRNA pseudouridine(38-40) synthase TruA [Lactobacillus sp. ESL0237]RMC42806.1 tRNA pseudouridine(38-40) synthase TruA [Lactobacillus sp. ESL0234]RMC43660.1 tRNA pseudouridine(38-40) synthase TruA [Lactobacillus sp. ESL0236]RMC44669.1 tRNA pseudouridine(38-40) synthase TruA [Lactobacillus sp. ESL0230]RMC47910.1 tRNA pseudouridine(38-40) synthase TruA [Lactobacillus sp. ESL0225]